MTAVHVRFHNPFPPHQIIAQTRAVEGSLSYGWVLGQPAEAHFRISRGDVLVTEQPEVFASFPMVTLERDDGFLPWVGFMGPMNGRLSDPVMGFTAYCHGRTLFAEGRTKKSSNESSAAAGTHIIETFQEAAARGEPPLLVSLGSVGAGPPITFTPKAESLLEFLRTMAEFSDWEWGFRYEVTRQYVRTKLLFQKRLGFDRRNEVVFQEGVAFKEAGFTRSPEGAFAASLAVGGTGTFKDRPAQQVNAAGRDDTGITGNIAGALAGVPTSPALMGTRVVVEQSVKNADALTAAARRSLRDPDLLRERHVLELVEANIDMDKLEIGSFYGINFKNLDFGLKKEGVVRCLSLDLGEDGIVRMAAEAA